MASKKKMKKPSKPKKRAAKKVTPTKAATKTVSRKKAKKRSAKKGKASVKRQTQKKDERLGTAAFLRDGQGPRSGGQAGDLQGLSRRESADSESVDELIEEGNAFEADAVIGVEDADGAD